MHRSPGLAQRDRRGRDVTATKLFLFWVFALLVVLFISAQANSASPRCRGLRPICRITQQAICVCPSRGCLDSKCAWICGAVSK